jgi:carboxypeptidase PM20D1
MKMYPYRVSLNEDCQPGLRYYLLSFLQIFTPRGDGIMGDPSKVSSPVSRMFPILGRTARSLFPGTVVAPALMIAGTDTRHYETLTDNIFRFIPMVLKPEDIRRTHGVNERLGVENYSWIIKFYAGVMEEASR